MKNSKQYIDLVKDVAFVNTTTPYLADELLELNTISGIGKARTLTKSIFDYLHDQLLLDEFAEAFSEEAKYVFNAPEVDDFLEYTSFYTGRFPTIAQTRIEKGYQAGLIDYISNALYRKDDGTWVDAMASIELPKEITLAEITEYIQSQNISILPSVTIDDLEEAEKTGVLMLNGKTIASKEHDSWIDMDSGRSFAEGELIRLLHHKHEPIAIITGVPEGNYYHANVTDSKQPIEQHAVRKNSSAQGDAFYATRSVDEAVRIYGNPKSFEISGKLLVLDENNEIDRSQYKFGHLYQTSFGGSCYKADFLERAITFNQLPSAASLMLLAKENDVPLGYAKNAWMQMKSSSSTYQVYATLNAFNQYARQYSGKTDCMTKALASLGFDGIEVEFPTSEQLNTYQEKLNEVKSIDAEEARELKLAQKTAMEQIERFIQNVTDAVPAKGQGAHVIMFDVSKVNSKHMGILPLNKALLGKKDCFYSREAEIKLEDVIVKEPVSEFNI